jgi:ribosomal protein S18 acetylase RimI-like enzyme
MELITHYDDVLYGIKTVRDFKEGYVTNFYPDKAQICLWIHLKIFFKLELTEGVVFFLKKNSDFCNFYFCSKSLESLENAISIFHNSQHIKVSVDIIGSKQMIHSIVNLMGYYDFKIIRKLTRMTRAASSFSEVADEHMTIATKTHASEIEILLYEYFDPYSEQLPLIQEIESWIKNKRVIIYSENSKVIGFIIFDLFGAKSYLRYWFVHPEFRDRKIGSKLLRKFFKICEKSKKQVFWVVDDNVNAINKYEYYGFKAEPMHDYVLIN